MILKIKKSIYQILTYFKWVILSSLFVFSCAENQDLEVSLGTSSTILIPKKSIQSCTQEEKERVSPPEVPVFDVGEKYFVLQKPRLKWNPKDDDLSIVLVQLIADKNAACGLSFTCVLSEAELGFIFGQRNASTRGYTKIWDQQMYGENTAANTNCTKNSDNVNSSGTAISCHDRTGSACTVRCGGVTANVEKCTASAKFEVIGIKRDKAGNETPIRSFATFNIQNEF